MCCCVGQPWIFDKTIGSSSYVGSSIPLNVPGGHLVKLRMPLLMMIACVFSVFLFPTKRLFPTKVMMVLSVESTAIAPAPGDVLLVKAEDSIDNWTFSFIEIAPPPPANALLESNVVLTIVTFAFFKSSAPSVAAALFLKTQEAINIVD